MLLAVVAASIALLLAIVAASSLVAFARGRRLLAARVAAAARATAVVAGRSVPASLVRALAVLPVEPPLGIRLACVRGEEGTDAAAADARREVPGADVHVETGVAPARHVGATWLAAHAVPAEEAVEGEGVVVLLDPRARPASRQLATVVLAATAADPLAVAACPTASRGAASPRSARNARALGDLAPVLFATAGSPALPPALVVAAGATMRAAAGDPLAMNRPSLAAAVACSGRGGALLPVPVGLQDEGPFASSLLRAYLLHLSRVRPWRTLAALASLLAVPLAVAARVVAGQGAAPVANAALVVAVLSRAALALTWSRAVHGPGPAVLGLVLSPVRDLVLAFLAARAVARSRIVVDGVLFRACKGGTLAPVAARDDDD
jgi:hypothetical protein